MCAAVCLRWMPSWTLGTMVGSAGAAMCLLPARTTVATTVPTVTQTRPKASLNKGT